ncbi:GNAT family N-acetyltransferase [Hoeflea sp. YIM 152468]|uniref:GNAT family N-acetyltransferase n=1 Tax=Hoeflea sp. YIM 152468 TaxID=3031759 RepID=UPI0023DB2B92|nr:GNAT family N-acetyltransferase [Hoeflea sp. YIM 152468]MDF1607807.1 GNAT family N-acetyltransferase [Hoeflea sp. YIM 152468]
MRLKFLFKPRQPQLATGGDVKLRYLGPVDANAFREHIHDLHFEDFRDRFNGRVSDEWLDRYIARSLNEAIVVGAFDDDHLVGVAELHTGGQIEPGEGESAFSVASDWRHKGVGTILIKALLRAASENDVATILVETGAQNHAMKALAQRFGARMSFAGDQSIGRIDVAHGLSLAARMPEKRSFPTPPGGGRGRPGSGNAEVRN